MQTKKGPLKIRLCNLRQVPGRYKVGESEIWRPSPTSTRLQALGAHLYRDCRFQRPKDVPAHVWLSYNKYLGPLI